MATQFSMKKVPVNFKVTEEELELIDERARVHRPQLNRSEYIRMRLGLVSNNMSAREFVSNPSVGEILANFLGKENEDGKKK